MARVLHLTTEFPWPATSGGPVRTLAQLNVLASLPDVERVTLLSVAERHVSERQREALAAAVPKLNVLAPVRHPIHIWRHPGHLPRMLAVRLRGVPYVAAKWDSRPLRRRLSEALRRSDADVVYIDHLGMARYLPTIRHERPQARVILEQHNVESELFKRFAESQHGLARRVALAEWRAAAAFEKRALESVDAVVAISTADAAAFERLAGIRAHVVPVHVEFTRTARAHPGRAHFCYVGSLRWRPNVAGLDWFCRDVWPMVRDRLPGATMEIAGVDLERDSRGRLPVPEPWKVPGIETIGFLEDLEPLYSRSVAMVAPVTGGSGVRLKVLEGLRAGIPVVTTPDGASGLPLTDGREALITGDPAGFADRIARVTKDEGLRVRLRDEGYAYLEAHHSLEAARAALQRALRP